MSLIQRLLRAVRALLNKITPTTRDVFVEEFLSYDISSSPFLNDVVQLLFDKAVDETLYCPLYSDLCSKQVRFVFEMLF